MAVPLTLDEVPSTTPYIQYVATSGQTVFPYPFPITQDSDLIVVANGTTLDTDAGYTLSGQGDDTGGDVTFTSGRTAGDIITLYRDVTIERVSQISQNSGFSSTTFNAEFNNIYLILQQLEASIAQCLQIPNTNNPAPTTGLTPTAYANKYLAFDANGNPEAAELTSSGSITASILAALLGVYTAAPILASYAQTAAEKALEVVPTDYTYPPYTLLRYGADPTGTDDSTTALQNAINCAQEANYAMVTVGVPGATLKIGSAWTLDTTLTGIDFQGAYIDASGFTTGNWWSPIQSNTDLNQRPLFNGAHPICNATILGPGSTNTTAVALYLDDPDPVDDVANCSGIAFRNLNFLDWGQDVVFNDGAFCINFSQCQFGSNAGAQTTYSVTMNTSASNAGERNTFSQCFWFNKAYCIDQISGSSDLFFSQCSFDGVTRAINASAGTVILEGCHLEGSSDTDYWVYATGVNGKVLATDLYVVLDAAKDSYALFYSDSTCTWGGIYIDKISVSAASGYGTLPLVDGTGNVTVRNYIGLGTAAGNPQFLSDAQNLIADATFSQNDLTVDDWSTSGTVAIVNSDGYGSNSYSVKFTGASSPFADLTSRTFPCRPGEQAFVQAVAKFPTFNTGASFTCKVSYVNADGNALSTVIGGTTGTGFQFMDITAESDTYTIYSTASSGGLGRAPPGTAGVVVSFSAGGATCVGNLGQIKVTIG